jgi:iturin family lipopeptide synthetase A
LPHYMVPRHIVLIEAMPLTPNGKINRQALPPPKSADNDDDDDDNGAPVRATSDTEALLLPLWARLLDVPRVQLDDDFFEIGIGCCCCCCCLCHAFWQRRTTF